MHKNIGVGIAVVSVIMLGVIVFAATRPAPVLEEPTLSLPVGSYTEHADYYDIAANYATSTPLGGAANAAAMSVMQNFISDTIAQFKTNGNFENLTPQDVKMMGFDQGRKEKLNILYLIGSSTNTLSYIFTIYEDTLGAHGNSYFKTFTFNTTSGKLLSLADVFSTRDYLSTLSTIARAKLPEMLRDMSNTSSIESGTTPEENNFENFFFDNRDFVILFPPYQVAAYAAGPQTLRIPLTELSNVLKSEYR